MVAHIFLDKQNWIAPPRCFLGSKRKYRIYLVIHEVGHAAFGLNHRAPDKGPHGLCPVMSQQTKGTAKCRANPWPRVPSFNAGALAKIRARCGDVIRYAFARGDFRDVDKRFIGEVLRDERGWRKFNVRFEVTDTAPDIIFHMLSRRHMRQLFRQPRLRNLSVTVLP